MKIAIAQRLHPFSHENGTKFLLPGTSYSVQVFPTLIHLTDLDGKLPSSSFSFDFAGPLKDFTAELDLEKGLLRIFGMTKKGFMRYILLAKKGGIELSWQKVPENFKRKNLWLPLALEEIPAKSDERLSLGVHKAQDWTLVRRRLDMKEIFPILFAMGNWTVSKASATNASGNYHLLEELRQKIQAGERQTILEAFQRFFLASFDGVLVPRLYDTEHQGILQDALDTFSNSPVPLLIEGSLLVRSLFIQKNQERIAILPCLPPEFHSGRMVGIKIDDLVIDLEWSKKALRRMRITAVKQSQIELIFPKGIASCRAKGKKQGVSQRHLPLSFKAKEIVDLDRFSQS